MNEKHGTTIVFVTHDALEAEKIIDRVGIMRRGELIVTGAPHALKQNLKGKLRLEIAFESGQAPELPDTVAPRKLTTTRWQIYLEAYQVGSVMQLLTTKQLTDIKLSTATLEDLYFHYVDSV